MAVGVIALAGLVYWLLRRKRQGKPTLIDPDLFRSKIFRFGISDQMLQQIALGGTMIALPIYLQMVLESNALQAGLSLAPLSLTMFATAIIAGRKAGARRPSSLIRVGFALLTAGLVVLLPIVPRADLAGTSWPPGGCGCGVGSVGVPAQQLHAGPDLEERVSEAG